jgi:hypothetical protein
MIDRQHAWSFPAQECVAVSFLSVAWAGLERAFLMAPFGIPVHVWRRTRRRLQSGECVDGNGMEVDVSTQQPGTWQ